MGYNIYDEIAEITDLKELDSISDFLRRHQTEVEENCDD